MELDPSTLIERRYGDQKFNLKRDLARFVGCDRCSNKLKCLVTGTHCIEYAKREIKWWLDAYAIEHHFKDSKKTDERFVVRIEMQKYIYSIHVVVPTSSNLKGYMGAGLLVKNGDGGRDLTDGSYSFTTFVAILFDILAVESRSCTK